MSLIRRRGGPAAGLAIELYRLGGGEEQLATRRRPMPTGASTGRCSKARTSRPASTSCASMPATICGARRRAALSGVPRRHPDPLRHRLGGRALSCAAAPLALRLFDLPGKLTDPMRNTIRFIRKGRMVELADVAPTTMLLDYLREIEGRQRHQGRLRRGRLRRLHGGARPAPRRPARLRAGQCLHPARSARSTAARSSRSRISPQTDGTLHPVQAAMVEHHGSQCGFCTPGFVMSLFALYQSTEGRGDARPRSTTGSPAISAAAPATGRSSMRRSPPAPEPRARPASRSMPATRPALLAFLADSEDVFVGDDDRFFAAPASSTASPRSTSSIPTRPSSPARPMSGCGSPSSCATCPRSSIIGRVRGFDHIEDTGYELMIGAGATYAQAEPHLARDRSRPRRAAPPARLEAGARRRHGRRQRRQRLADRRHAAGADRARRDARAAQGQAGAHRCRSRSSSSTTASRTASRANSSPASLVPKLDAEPDLPLLQDLQALRPGHLLGDGRLPLHGRRGRRDHARRASPLAAWRRRRGAPSAPSRR